MAVTFASFVEYFPEFKGDETAGWQTYVERHLTNAEVRTPADVWGDLQDQGILYLAAHLLAIAPFGINAKLGSSSGKSVYGTERRRLATVVCPHRNAGYDATNA